MSPSQGPSHTPSPPPSPLHPNQTIPLPKSGTFTIVDQTGTLTNPHPTNQLKELTESGRIRPELLKTHKQRVEELNAHLARLSEHHDMPKIGPG